MNKLILDEKKIRKGKPVGLPYVGSKKKISKKIIEIIKQNFNIEGKVIYDVFGGGGAITSECIINGLPVVYNDLDKSVVDMFTRVISSNKDYLKTLIISYEEFIEIRDKNNKTIDDNLKLLMNSFGNNRQTYMYSKGYSDLKFNLAKDIIKNHDLFVGYKQTDTYKKACITCSKKELQHIKRVEQLARMQQLERLQQLEEKKSIIDITIKEYIDFSNIKNSILYLDPPYENSENMYINGSFD